MLFKTASALALLAVSARAATEPMLFKMSIGNDFGLARRQSGGGSYQPSQTFCGTGNTCAQACGQGYATCPSVDNAIHCYNAAASQSCCSDGTGSMFPPLPPFPSPLEEMVVLRRREPIKVLITERAATLDSCDPGFYCAASASNGTLCCAQGQTPDACAKAYGLPGTLSSETSAAASYPTASLASSGAPGAYPTSGSTGSYPAANGTKTSSTTSPSKVPLNGASAASPAIALLAAAAALAAAL